jgi:hypothetical protein
MNNVLRFRVSASAIPWRDMVVRSPVSPYREHRERRSKVWVLVWVSRRVKQHLLGREELVSAYYRSSGLTRVHKYVCLCCTTH